MTDFCKQFPVSGHVSLHRQLHVLMPFELIAVLLLLLLLLVVGAVLLLLLGCLELVICLLWLLMICLVLFMQL